MSWGKWIIISFVFFAGFIATLVTVCMQQDVNLVTKDFYKEELAYQDQITRVNNTNRLQHKPVIRVVGDGLEIEYLEFNTISNGTLKLFRPSDPELDRKFLLETTTSHKQTITVADLEKGMYRAQMQWVMDGKEYFVEQVINL